MNLRTLIMEFKYFFSILYLFLGVSLGLMQSFQVISIGSVSPDFLLLLTIVYALSRGSFKGEILGFFLGLILDLMSGALFGLNAFVFTLVGACATPFQKIAKLPNIIVFILYIILITIVKYILYYVFFMIYRETSLFDFYFFLKIPGEILINIIFGSILYIICARFDIREKYEWY